MMTWLARLFVRILFAFGDLYRNIMLGTRNIPGLIYRARQSGGLFLGVVLIPLILTMIFGWIFIKGFGLIGTGRVIMMLGFLVSNAVLIAVVGSAMSLMEILLQTVLTPFKALFSLFSDNEMPKWNLPVSSEYLNFIGWVMLIELGLIVLLPYGMSEALLLGVVAFVAIGITSGASETARTARLWVFRSILIWAVLVSLPSAISLRVAGVDFRDYLDFRRHAIINQWEWDKTHNLLADAKRDLLDERLSSLQEGIGVVKKLDGPPADREAMLKTMEAELATLKQQATKGGIPVWLLGAVALGVGSVLLAGWLNRDLAEADQIYQPIGHVGVAFAAGIIFLFLAQSIFAGKSQAFAWIVGAIAFYGITTLIALLTSQPKIFKATRFGMGAAALVVVLYFFIVLDGWVQLREFSATLPDVIHEGPNAGDFFLFAILATAVGMLSAFTCGRSMNWIVWKGTICSGMFITIYLGMSALSLMSQNGTLPFLQISS